jgi:hypothetical protein
MVLPQGGLNETSMGGGQTKQPLLVEEAIWPAIMVATATSAFPLVSLAKNASQATANPAVQATEHILMTVSKVSEPSTQMAAQSGTRQGHAVPIRAFCLLPYRILEFLQTLRSRQTQFAAEVIAQKVKSFGAGIYDPGLGRMQRQFLVYDPLLHQPRQQLYS